MECLRQAQLQKQTSRQKLGGKDVGARSALSVISTDAAEELFSKGNNEPLSIEVWLMRASQPVRYSSTKAQKCSQ